MEVIVAKINKIIITKGWFMFISRIRRNTPAVTSVEEWTRAEIGVGAAIAAGNHAENGNCALFEQAANINRIRTIFGNSSFIEKFQFIVVINILIEIRIITSPIRFERIVIVPEEDEGAFW